MVHATYYYSIVVIVVVVTMSHEWVTYFAVRGCCEPLPQGFPTPKGVTEL